MLNLHTTLMASVCALMTVSAFANAEEANHPPKDVSNLVEWIESTSGRILLHDSGVEFVYASPPGDLWQLEDDRSIMRSARLVYRDETLFAHWDDGSTSEHSIDVPLPVILTDERHALADFWGRFIGRPLTAPLGTLPVGTVFAPEGVMELPDVTHSPAKWFAFGDSVKISSTSFEPQRFHWKAMDQSIQPLEDK